MACVFVVAYEDNIVEDEEIVPISVIALNPNDVVNGSTYVIITDNDGKAIFV